MNFFMYLGDNLYNFLIWLNVKFNAVRGALGMPYWSLSNDIDGITYMNDGDWVESCTALVEHWDGRWELLEYDASGDKVVPLIAHDTPAALTAA